MLRLSGILLLVLLLPRPSAAIQLHWLSGASDLTFSSATRCTLVVQADSAEVTLPSSWRLQWVADSSGVQFSALDPTLACLADTARVDSIAPPSTPADSAANQFTACFCSAGSAAACTAYFLVDLAGGSKGKLKVVALNPADTTQVIESNEVTLNGGIDGDYAPVLLSATSTHVTALLQVNLAGSGLRDVQSLRVGAPDSLWSVPLAIISKSDAALTGTADVPTLLPASIVVASGSSGSSAEEPLGPDRDPEVDPPGSSLPDTVLFRDPNWTSNSATTVYPKDFAFFYNVVAPGGGPWRGLFHLIYIRHNNNFSGDPAESSLVHAWSPNLRNWKVDKLAFLPEYANPDTWDNLHVWAPSLLPVGNELYMFITGVDQHHNQRIGYAKTSLFDTSDTQWSSRTMVYEASNTTWADQVGHTRGAPGQQFRDPWVMPDPDHANKFLLFNIGEDLAGSADSLGYTVVGVARNQGSNLDSWTNLGAYRATDYWHTGSTRIESPLVIRDSSGVGAGPWRMFLANGPYNDVGSNSTYFVTDSLGASVSDTTLRVWPGLDSLYTYVGNDHSVLGWQACEHIQVGPFHFFAGYNGDGIAVTRTLWDPATHNFVITNPVTGVQGKGSSGRLRFYLTDFRPGAQSVSFNLELPGRMAPRLVVYDLAGWTARLS